jgi:hypothetical protein
VRSGPVSDTVANDLKRVGVDPATLPAWMREEQTDDEVIFALPENWEAVTVFNHCSTQWHRSGSGVPTGLRYQAVELVIAHSKVADPDDVFARVLIMEKAALPILVKNAIDSIKQDTPR